MDWEIFVTILIPGGVDGDWVLGDGVEKGSIVIGGLKIKMLQASRWYLPYFAADLGR